MTSMSPPCTGGMEQCTIHGKAICSGAKCQESETQISEGICIPDGCKNTDDLKEIDKAQTVAQEAVLCMASAMLEGVDIKVEDYHVACAEVTSAGLESAMPGAALGFLVASSAIGMFW